MEQSEQVAFKDVRQIGTLSGHTSWITKICVSSECSDLLVTSSRDKSVLIWKLYMKDSDLCGKLMKSLVGHNHFISDCSLSNDGGHLITSSWDKTLKLWDIKTGISKRTFIGHTNDVTSVAFSYDNRQIVSGSRDRSVRLWNTLAVQKFCFEDNGHEDCVSSVAAIPKDKTIEILSAGNDGLIKKWQLAPPQCTKTYSGHNVAVTSMSISPNFKMMVSGDKNGLINVWNIEKENYEKSIDEQGSASTVAFHPHYPLFAVGVGSTVNIHNVNDNAKYMPIVPYDSCDVKTQPKVTSLCWGSDGYIIYVGYNDAKVRIYALDRN